MNNQRRQFLNQLSFITAFAALNKPMGSIASISKHINTLHSVEDAVTVYHTNDLHGNFNAVFNGSGGIPQIKALLQKQETNGLILDAGDFLNPAHSLSKQQEVIYAMNSMGYLAATIGDNELSLGEDHLAQLIPLMNFKLVNCNYQFTTALSKLITPYIIINSGKFKIGITGVGHQIKGVKYNDAVACANNIADVLKHKEKCDLVICLSHLGYEQRADMPDNRELARQSENIDMIISGHNRKLLKGSMVLLNKQKQEVVLNQAGWDGLMMGKAVFNFKNGNQKSGFRGKNIIPGHTNESFVSVFPELRLMEKQLIAS